MNRFLDSVNRAEDKLGRPPQPIEIFVELSNSFNLPIRNVFEASAVITSLQREDLIYTNEIAS